MGIPIEKLSPKLKELIRKSDPTALYPVAGLRRPVAKPAAGGQGQDQEVETSKRGFRVCIVSFRTTLLDEHDNLRAAHKQLVDFITSYLGYSSDADPRLHWQYEQIVSKNRGTLVTIQEI